VHGVAMIRFHGDQQRPPGMTHRFVHITRKNKAS